MVRRVHVCAATTYSNSRHREHRPNRKSCSVIPKHLKMIPALNKHNRAKVARDATVVSLAAPKSTVSASSREFSARSTVSVMGATTVSRKQRHLKMFLTE